MAQRHHDPAGSVTEGRPTEPVQRPRGGGPPPADARPPDTVYGPTGARGQGPKGYGEQAAGAPQHEGTGPAGARVPGERAVSGDGLAVSRDRLTGQLQDQATEFLRSLRLHRESGGTGNGGEEPAEAVRALRRAARRIGGNLHTFRPLLDPEWCDGLRAELAWLSSTLGHEHACAARLDRLLGALHRLSGVPGVPAQHSGADELPARAARERSTAPAGGERRGQLPRGRSATANGTRGGPPPAPGAGPPPGLPAAPPAPSTLTVGAAKAGALLERQLTLARTRAHSTALQALGSSRFHALADRVAVLASEVPLVPGAAGADLGAFAAESEARLGEAVAALPLHRAGRPYNAEALAQSLAVEAAPHAQDGPWHQVRLLLRLHRYAREVLRGERPQEQVTDGRLADAGRALDRHRDAAEAAAAAAAAARTPRIAPSTAYALGVLHADQRNEVEAARLAFHEAWLREAVRTR